MPPPPPPSADPLAELRARLESTRAAAERLVEEVPAAGWASPAQADRTRDDVEAIAGLVRALRELVPAELQEQVTDLLRQVLLLLRALLDWWVARLEPGPPAAGTEVQDIPVG
jgi:hypothetical protein